MSFLPTAPSLRHALTVLRPAPLVDALPPLAGFEHEGFDRAADFRADVAALPAELTRLYEAHLHLERTPVEPSPAEVLAARRAVALALVAVDEEEARLDRRLADLADRRQTAYERLATVRARQEAAETADRPALPPDPLWHVLWTVAVPVLALFLVVFYTNSIYLGFFSSAPTTAGLTAAEQGAAFVSALALFRGDLLWQACGAVMPLLGALAVLVVALIVQQAAQQPATRQRYWAVLGGMLAVDVLLAYFIHKSAADVRQLMNMTAPATTDIVLQFGLIVGFGFGLTFVLSVALGHLLEARAQRHPEYQRQQALRETAALVTAAEGTLDGLCAESETLREASAAAVATLRRQITDREVDLLVPRERITYDGRLRAILDHYYAGWLRQVGQRNQPLEPHQQAYRTFREEFFTARAGTYAAA